MDCEYNIDGLTFSKEEFLNYIKKQPLNEVAEVLGIEPVPKAPFITDTAKYLKLGWKMMLREAVAQGATKIAWTTGEQQADRFNLSKQVDEIIANKMPDGTYNVFGNKNGSTIVVKDNIKENELDGVVGKELAQKIINGENLEDLDVIQKAKGVVPKQSFKGNDLKVGGEGMKAFYGDPVTGNIGFVGEVAKSLFKQEPKTVKINGDGTNKNVVDKLSEKYETSYATLNKAVRLNELEKLKELGVSKDDIEIIKNSSQTTQHSIDITPELIRMVDGGISLFSKMSDDRESITSIPIPAGFTIIPQEEDWVSIADQNGYEGYMMSKDEALKQIKDKFPVGTPEMSDPTVTDLFRFFYDLSLKQIGTILQWNDPNGEYADWINSETYDVQRNNLTNDYAQAREILRSRINDWFNEGADVELTGLYVPADGNGDSTNLFDVNEDQYDRVIQELIDSGEIETIDPDTKEPCNSYSYQ